MKTKQYKIVEDYVRSITENPSKAWDVPIGNKVIKDDYYATASYSQLSKQLGVSTQVLQGLTAAADLYNPLMKKLNDVLKNEGVLLKHQIASALELRRNAVNWWRSLSLDDKKKLMTFGNSIRFNKYIQNWRGGQNYEILTELGEQINQEMVNLGILNSDYVKVKDRDALRDKSFLPDQQESKKRWEELGQLTLESVDDLVIPSDDTEPFVQLKQLAAALQQTVSSQSAKDNFRDGFNHFCNFLKKNRINENELLQNILDEFSLKRFKEDYVLPALDSSAMSPTSAPTIISAIRGCLRRAKSIKGLGFHGFYDVEMTTRGRTGNYYKPYSPKEREAISAAIMSDINMIKQILTPYRKTGLGQNPLDNNGHIKLGMRTLDNARYLFENELNCQPVFHHTAKSESEKALLSIVGYSDIGLHDLYKSWGILPVVDIDVLAPFLLRLAQITGMNADPLGDLTLDDFLLEHPATGKPCLRYWKERSTGEKELHLDLFQAKLQWLTRKQSKEVQDIFETVKMLTASLRDDAPEELRNVLFIYKSSGRNSYGVVKTIRSEKLSHVYSNFVSKHQLQDDNGETMSFSISRFRSTFVSELIEAGVSIREIQLLLGHSNIETTMNYLDRLDFNRIARQKLKETLENIHKKVITPTQKGANKRSNERELVIFSTPLGGCSNLFSPPDFIKNSSLYVAGQPCAQYNKCLTCDNVMLIAEHLPMLFAMKRDYMILMQRNRIMETPYGIVIEENLAVLDEILNPKKSDFSEEELEKGERLSQFEQTAFVDWMAA